MANTLFEKILKGASGLRNIISPSQIVIHKRALLNRIPEKLLLPLFCGKYRNKLRKPDNLTILLVHNYPEKSIMEKSLEYVGIHNYTLLRPVSTGEWSHTAKPTVILEYLKSGKCQTEYVLFCDSDDAILIRDPAKTIELLHENQCEMLISTTDWEGGYECMSHIEQWATSIAAESGYMGKKNIHLNSGVYIAKTEFLKEVLEESAKYITDHDLPVKEYRQLKVSNRLCEALPNFPQGVGSDQVILRFIHPKFYPRMKLDYNDRLAFR